ncbi:Trp biosynthesis-associated membrane protein [Nocardioides KLBMP 9356]|uniref:Trp biosynthesis-associated membrane protein n=1 Tax=Nocardioides potassii TaxID=2911371 RepID=A0ABS9H8I5_9ACTN|nr:Trp biosynthesis-associated membrane protein [Nocardioides potassii]MCF6377531.1 Trp biosynthesis-associated membrane protein [Nocardioides potassii]
MADEQQPVPDRRRRTFGPVVLLGVASAGLASVAGTKPWVSGESGSIRSDDAGAVGTALSLDTVAESPLAAALALVLLACWGVLLVTRGRFRQAVAVLALVTALGLVAATVEAFWRLPGALADALREVSGADAASTSLTAWYPVALVASFLGAATSLAAVRLVRSWPEMGTKYDAPAGAPGGGEAATGDLPTENIDIWKALDEGRDPTA